MTSREQAKRGLSRRFAWLAAAIVAGIALYTAGWFYVAGRLEAEVAETLANARTNGAEADCAEAEARGYPFRLGLFCDSVTYKDPTGLALDGTGLRSAAQIYQPWRIVGELDRIALEFDGTSAGLALEAADIRYSTRLGDDLPERISVTGRALAASSAGAAPFADAAAGEAHLRRTGIDLDVALSFSALRWKQAAAGGAPLPPLDGDVDLTLADGVRLATTRPASPRGTSGEIRAARIGTDATGLTLSGPFSIGTDGLLDATLTLSIRNPQALSVLLAEAFPQIRPQVDQTGAIIAALGDNPQLPLSVSKGVVRMGFFTLGRIPPL